MGITQTFTFVLASLALLIFRLSQAENFSQVKVKAHQQLSPPVKPVSENKPSLLFHPAFAEHCRLSKDTKSSKEGSSLEGYDLKKVFLLLTPGHRGHYINFENITSPYQNCEFEQHAHLSEHPKVKDFPEVAEIYKYLQPDKGGFKIYDPFPKKKLCEDDELSPFGTQQSILLGETLAQRYPMFKFHQPRRDEFVIANSVHAKSSFQTIFPFLHGLLHEKNFVRVKVQKSLPNFCHLSHHCSCPKTEYLEKKIAKAIRKGFHIFKDIPNIYPDLNLRLRIPQNAELAPREIITYLASWICDANAYPCQNGKCFDLRSQNVNDIFLAANDHLDFITNNEIFKRYAKLMTYPFLSRVFDWLGNEEHHKMAIFSSEEDFFTAVLSVLGVSTDFVLPQSSRLVIEIHESQEKNQILKFYFNGFDVSDQLSVSKDLSASLHFSPVKEFYIEDILNSFKNRDYMKECLS